jgi:hypothetical protein
LIGALGVVSALAACGKSSSDAPRVGPGSGQGGECHDCGGGEGGVPNAAGSIPVGGTVFAGSAGEPASPAGQGPSEAGAAGQAGHAGSGPVTPPELVLRSVTLSQTLEAPLMQAGAATAVAERPVPVIAGKRALVRAFVDLDASFRARPLLGVLDLKTAQGTRSLVSERSLAQSSLQDDLSSTFVFDVSASDVTATTSYRVRVLEADTSPLARFPDSGYLQLGAQALPPFRLVVVPFISNGFAPKTGDAELSALRSRLLALYPTATVELTLGKPVDLGYDVNANGDGWDDALDEIYDVRLASTPPSDVFYYGLMAPAASYDAYCPESCVVGFSNLADESDEDSRGSIGIGAFQDGSGAKDAWDTAVHELGHALGREHAPCGIDDPSDIDPYWPDDTAHRSALIGLYGYDFDLQKLVRPRPAKDVMSYCSPIWISDYTYQGVFERLKYIGAESSKALSVTARPQFRLARIRQSGESRWLGKRTKNGSAARRDLPLLDRAGTTIGSVAAQVARVDHGRGGYVWLPEAELLASGAASVDLRPLGGSVLGL